MKSPRAKTVPRFADGAWILKIVAESLRSGNCHVPVGAWSADRIGEIEKAARFLKSYLHPPASSIARLERAVVKAAMNYAEVYAGKIGVQTLAANAQKSTMTTWRRYWSAVARLELARRRVKGAR